MNELQTALQQAQGLGIDTSDLGGYNIPQQEDWRTHIQGMQELVSTLSPEETLEMISILLSFKNA